ncbi:hypothetical protein QE152_g3740 [Popillia japonica]|uniref:Uncharacterized protein n=1 Tax=Popillia japonica TaxID=7064 RepID=A0AAW1N2Z2_POPJA
MENAYVERRIETVNKIKAVLEENGAFDSLASVLDEIWPKEIYKSTELQSTTKAATTGYQEDHAILVNNQSCNYGVSGGPCYSNGSD